MNAKKAFTLIELLVVIAIIAILAAILFPVFAQAKAAAKKTAGLSNVKQLSLASIMYAGDADDTFCYGTTGRGPNNDNPSTRYRWQDNWIMNSAPYIKNLDIFRSPGDSHKADNPGYDTGPTMSFVGNSMACYNGAAGRWDSHGIFTNNSQLQDSDAKPVDVVSATSVGSPADVIMIAERWKLIKKHADGDGRSTNPRGMFDTSDVTAMGAYYRGTFPGELDMNDADCAFGRKPCAGTNYEINNKYSGSGLFSFVDGHAKAMKPEQTIDYSVDSIGDCNNAPKGYKNWDRTRS